MRSAAFFLIFLAACASDPDPTVDGGSDAGEADAASDAGGMAFACKGLTCNSAVEYCRLTPVGACNIMDAGTCGAGQEACVSTGGNGCTPERTPSCEPLGACSDCACLVNLAEPCGAGLMSIQCLRRSGAINLECPYP